MTAEQFIYWFQGFIEVANPKQIDAQQTQVIKDHLALVFNKVTPSYPVALPLQTPYPSEVIPVPQRIPVTPPLSEFPWVLPDGPTCGPICGGMTRDTITAAPQTYCAQGGEIGFDAPLDDSKGVPEYVPGYPVNIPEEGSPVIRKEYPVGRLSSVPPPITC